MNQEQTEHLLKLAANVGKSEQRYAKAKYELELLKADHILKNDWESLIGKKKPTVAEKEAFILQHTEEKNREVIDLKVQRDYCRRVFDINMMTDEYVGENEKKIIQILSD